MLLVLVNVHVVPVSIAELFSKETVLLQFRPVPRKNHKNDHLR